ncbi:putative membrane protein [Nakaseomyces bracarensis]|uniref:Membrane protein n=1 Tax=Nakaseomyces bracarensis TaxID=273131 RepID=A0ABR4NY81_9SACH
MSVKRRAIQAYNLYQHYFPTDRILAQRIFKATVNTTVAFIFTLIPKVRDHLGGEPAMLPLISVIVHPGRRVGGTIKGAIYCTTGLLFGLAYSLLGRFLARKCLGDGWDILTESQQKELHFVRYRAALAILAMFETIMLFVHGWMRSVNHLYFGIVFPVFLVVHFTFMAPLKTSAADIANNFSTPFYLGIAMSIFFNLTLFPEFGSTYLGNAAIDAFKEMHKSIRDTVQFFINSPLPNDNREEPVSLTKLLKCKTTVRAKINNCETVLEECLYEFSYSYLSPVKLNPLLPIMKDISIYITGLVNACQLEFMLLKELNLENIEKLRELVENIGVDIDKTLKTDMLLLAYAFDVSTDRIGEPAYKDKKKKELLNGVNPLNNIEELKQSLDAFKEKVQEEILAVDIDLLKPDEELFLFSTFLINLKQTIELIIDLTLQVNAVYESRLRREQRKWPFGRSFWIPFFQNYKNIPIFNHGKATENDALRGTLNGAGERSEFVTRRPSYEEQELLNQQAQTNRNNDSDLVLPFSRSSTLKQTSHFFAALPVKTHRFMVRSKEHFRFGFQVVVALMLASFPMFIPKTRAWYISYRGTWIGFVCILCLEPSVGGTFWVFFLRGVGVIVGAAWGYLSYAAGIHNSNPYLETVITVFGAVPGFYFLLGSPYVKAAIIQIISIYVVILAAMLPRDDPPGILLSFAKRCLAVGYGGGIALIVQLFFFPVKARDQLNEEISFICGCISEMELLYAVGLDGEEHETELNENRFKKINKLSSSAKSALSRATAYKGLTRQEPRLKGEYTGLENIFTEVIFVLQQIVERMDNQSILRRHYGNSIAKGVNPLVFAYRRQLVGSTISLFRATQEAFINKTPLPQFLPSARLAHRRLLVKISKILPRFTGMVIPKVEVKRAETGDSTTTSSDSEEELTFTANKINENKKQMLDRETFLTWNATSAATEEIIDYIEELLELTKLLVGVNEFKYGFLSRPIYEDWAAEAATGFDKFLNGGSNNNLKPAATFNEEDEFETVLQEGTTKASSARNTTNNTAASSRTGPADAPNFDFYAMDSISSNITSDLDSEMSGSPAEPIALHEGSKNNKGEIMTNTSLNLARIASHKAGSKMDQLPKKFRDRSFSIGTVADQLPGLSKKKTLGEANADYYNDSTDTSDEDLPLVLKRIVSRGKKKGN